MVGQRVSAFTSANGCYFGHLVEVTEDRPWYGKVPIDAIQSVAQCFAQLLPLPHIGRRE